MLLFTAVNLSSVDLNLLWVLHVVLEEKSVARAAKRLHVTSPAVSNALARSRALLGDPLFVRSGRTLAPTPRALELAPALARSLGELGRAVLGGPSFDPRTTTRELSIALADADQIATLPKLARKFQVRLPRAKLEVVSIDTLVALGGLAGSTIDLAIGPRQPNDGLKGIHLYDEQAVFVARRGHPRIQGRITPERFRAELHVDIHLALGRAGIGHGLAEEALAQHGLVRNVALVVPSFSAAAAVVAATDLVTGLPLRVAQALRSSLGLQILRGPEAPFHFEMHLLWHERTETDPARACLAELISEHFAAPRSRVAQRHP